MVQRSGIAVVAVVGAITVSSSGLGRTARGATKQIALSVTPGAVLVDQAVRIRASGLRLRQLVTLEVSTRDRVGVVWRSRTQVKADGHGAIDTRGAMKPFWSMQPVERPAATTQFALTRGPMRTTVRLLSEGKTVASSTVFRSTESAQLVSKDLTVAIDGLAGTYYSRPGQGSRPAVVMLDGSGGGHSELPAALIASHGYSTLSLGYFAEPGLPRTLTGVPLEYFAKALRWLGAQAGVDAQRMTVVGISRGGEAALLIAANYPTLVHGVVACTPSADVLAGDPSGPAWTIGGKAVPLGPIPVESITAKTWATGGGKDELFDSAQAVRDLLARSRHHANITGAVYPNAGHAIGCVIPNQPLPQQFSLGSGGYFERGGTPAANEAAAAASWPHIAQLLNTL